MSKLKMSPNHPTMAGYYWAVHNKSSIPKIVLVACNGDSCWVQDYLQVVDESLPLVDGHVQGYVFKLHAFPLSDYRLWSDSIPSPKGYHNLFVKTKSSD